MGDRVRRITALARLTIIDGIKRHALIGLILFALAGEAAGIFFFDFIPRDIGRATNDFVFSISFITGVIFLLFHAVQVAAWDNDHRTIHLFLARPISRVEYLLGIFCGLAFLLFLLNIILGGIGWAILKFTQDTVGSMFFRELSLGFYLLSIGGLLLIELVLLSVVILFASIVRGNFPVLLLTLAYYCICNGLPVVRESIKTHSSTGNELSALFLQFLSSIFPNFSMLDFKGLVVNGISPPATSEIVFIFSIFLLYTVMLLWIAAFSFNKKDLM